MTTHPAPSLAVQLDSAFNHHVAGRLDAARAGYAQVLAAAPQTAFAHHGLGLIALAQQRAADALPHMRQAVALEPDNAQFNSNLGVALTQAGQAENAVGAHHKALALDPHNPEFHFNLGTTLELIGQTHAAIEAYQRAVAGCPEDAEFQFKLGCALMVAEDLEAAHAALSRAVQGEPHNAAYQAKLGLLCIKLERVEAAHAALSQAVALDPTDAFAHCCLGIVNMRRVKVEAAKASFERALALAPQDPRYQYNLGLAHLTLGDFPRGWAGSRARLPLFPDYYANPRNLPLVDRDTPRDTPVLVVREQGFGDEIQFARFLPQLAQRFPNLRWYVHPTLARLFQASFPQIEVSTDVEQASAASAALLPIMNAPWLLDTLPETLPLAPYLSVPPGALRWGLRLPPSARLRVGIAWGGSKLGKGAEVRMAGRRNLSVEAVRPLLQETCVDWVSLQLDRPEQLRALQDSGCAIADYAAEIKDFANTAALVSQLDLVIAVDTAVVHLTGALGKPVWMLNRFDSCWRWMLEREDSPWYPTLRMFRQGKPGDWGGVIERVRGALGGWQKGRSAD